MTAVMIGVDPHKGSHTAVAIGVAEQSLGKLRVDASDRQAGELVARPVLRPEGVAPSGSLADGPRVQGLVAAAARRAPMMIWTTRT